MADARADLIALSDYVYERTRSRLDGLTDTEYLWEPVPGCWTIRRAASGKYQADHSDSPGFRPSRRSRGGCGTSLSAMEEYGIRSGWDSTGSPRASKETIRRLPAQRRPSASWNVPTRSGKA
jgi:hypothetical protein